MGELNAFLYPALFVLSAVGLAAAVILLWRRNNRLASEIEEQRDEIEVQKRELAALSAISAVVSNELGLPETLEIALRTTLELMELSAGAIFVADAELKGVEIAMAQGLDESCTDALDNLPIEEGFLEPVISEGQTIVLSNLTVDRSFDPLYACGFRRLALAPLVARGRVLGALLVTTHTQRIFSEDDMELLTSVGGQIGIAVENSHFLEAVEHRAEQFRLIGAVGRRFSSYLDIDQLLAQLVRLIQQTYGYYHVAIGLIEDDEVVYRTGAGHLWDDDRFEFRPARLRVGQEGLSGWVAGTGQPLLIPDVSRDPRYVWMEGSRCLSELVVPVAAKGAVIGVLDVQSDRLNDFDNTDLVVIQALANQAAIAIENARLYEQAQQLAIVEERARLARELHDAVTQNIYSLTLLAEAGLRMIANGDLQQVEDNQRRIDDIAQQTLQDMRLLVYELRPAELKDMGLARAIERRLEVVERRAGIEARLAAPNNLDLAQDLEEEIYRIVQEGLNNALKHARATAIMVTIERDGAYLSLTISDDGRGFEPTTVGEQSGLGLANMKDRAARIGGRLQVDSAPAQGTVISLRVLCGGAGEGETSPQLFNG